MGDIYCLNLDSNSVIFRQPYIQGTMKYNKAKTANPIGYEPPLENSVTFFGTIVFSVFKKSKKSS